MHDDTAILDEVETTIERFGRASPPRGLSFLNPGFPLGLGEKLPGVSLRFGLGIRLFDVRGLA